MSGDDPRRRGLDRWAAFLETLDMAALDRLDALTTPEVGFTDPFNDTRGRAAMRAVFAHTLETCRDLSFSVSHRGVVEGLGVLRWRFVATVGVVGRIDAPGMSEVHLDGDGRVSHHIDHWDAGAHIYQRLPVLGPALRLIRRRIAAPAGAGRTG